MKKQGEHEDSCDTHVNINSDAESINENSQIRINLTDVTDTSMDHQKQSSSVQPQLQANMNDDRLKLITHELSDNDKNDSLSMVNSDESDFAHNSPSVDIDSISDCITMPAKKPISLYEKIHQWSINNIYRIPLVSITELLQVLRSEGFGEFPCTAQTFLHLNHSIKLDLMLTKKGTNGEYIYLGIQKNLERIIIDEYTDDYIHVHCHIDGMKIFKDTVHQLWPILLKIDSKSFVSKPFVVALYYGDAKPKSVNEFLKDFVEECQKLIREGLVINSKHFSFKLLCIIGDAPARAYIKSIKGPTGFYGCERCMIKGITIKSRRIYPDIDCDKRTKRSFLERDQRGHHIEEDQTLLTEIPDFNPIADVVLDSLHLLYLGVMKSLMEKWLSPGSQYRLKKIMRDRFRDKLKLISTFVTKEFQRKVFDIDEFLHWKATQYRFLLLYAGPIVLNSVLSPDEYKHFMLLHIGCRILCSSEFAVKFVGRARTFLNNFFLCLPELYGAESQIMIYHSLTHLADDVEHMNAPVTDYSAFWGESFIGKFKNLVYSTAKPIPQIINRLKVIENSDEFKIKNKKEIDECILKKKFVVKLFNNIELFSIDSIKINDYTITDKQPNNTILLKNNHILVIHSLFISNTSSKDLKLENIYFEGVTEEKKCNFFNKPCNSIELNMSKITNFVKSPMLNGTQFKCKCLKIDITDGSYIIPLLHN